MTAVHHNGGSSHERDHSTGREAKEAREGLDLTLLFLSVKSLLVGTTLGPIRTILISSDDCSQRHLHRLQFSKILPPLNYHTRHRTSLGHTKYPSSTSP